MRVSHGTLTVLAAAVWYAGGAVLLWKGAERLLFAAGSMGGAWVAGAGLVAVGFGLIQGRTVFRRSCRRNLQRIRTLKSPRPALPFHPWFFLALGTMITAGVILAGMSEWGPSWALAVGMVDWGVAFSLLVSSEAFWMSSP